MAPADDIATAQVVLDTNVVLDWLVFADPVVEPLAGAISGAAIRWVVTPEMREELASVLSRPAFARRVLDPERLLARVDALTSPADRPLRTRPEGLRCSDPDDQKFVDCALACAARWLVTRDRALLALAGQARKSGLSILVPAAWNPLRA